MPDNVNLHWTYHSVICNNDLNVNGLVKTIFYVSQGSLINCISGKPNLNSALPVKVSKTRKISMMGSSFFVNTKQQIDTHEVFT